MKELFQQFNSLLLSWSYDPNCAVKDNVSAMNFMNGFYYAKRSNDPFFKYFTTYLEKEHGINSRYNSWKAQIDHYAFNHNKDWFGGIWKLFMEISDRKLELNLKTEVQDLFTSPSINAKPYHNSKYVVQGFELSTGDFLQLSDKIGDDFKLTKLFDASLRNPSWDLFFPSDKDFEAVDFYCRSVDYKDRAFHERARRLFSHAIVKIDRLAIYENQVIAFAGPFCIFLDQAFKLKEVKKSGQHQSKTTYWVERLIEDLKGFWYIDSSQKSPELLADWFHQNMYSMDLAWAQYFPNMNGVWFPTKNHPERENASPHPF